MFVLYVRFSAREAVPAGLRRLCRTQLGTVHTSYVRARLTRVREALSPQDELAAAVTSVHELRRRYIAFIINVKYLLNLFFYILFT